MSPIRLEYMYASMPYWVEEYANVPFTLKHIPPLGSRTYKCIGLGSRAWRFLLMIL